MSKFKGLKATKKSKFINEEIVVRKLSVNQVYEIQDLIKTNEAQPSAENSVRILITVVKNGAPELSDLSDEDIKDFPLDELTRLSNEILEFSGIVDKAAK